LKISKSPNIKVLLLIGFLLIFCCLIFTHLLLLFTVGFFSEIKKSDVIIILGNTVESNGQPSLRLKGRLDKGIELYNDGYSKLIVASGGIGKEGYDEALVMKKYLIENGIPENNIIEDNKGSDTYESAKNLKSYLIDKNTSSVIVVSQYFHLLRSELAFKQVGFSEVYVAKAYSPFEIRDLYSIPREMIGFYYYIFKY